MVEERDEGGTEEGVVEEGGREGGREEGVRRVVFRHLEKERTELTIDIHRRRKGER